MDEHYVATYALYLERLRCEYLISDFATAERRFPLIVSNARTMSEISEAYRVRVVSC